MKQEKTYTVSIENILGCVAMQAYKLHPYHKPPHLNNILNHLRTGLRTIYQMNYFEISKEELRNKLKSILMDCKEFRQLNISKYRWKHGQRDIYDEDKYLTMCSENQQENDFIDLDAFLQNVNYEFWILHNNYEDCFLCKFAKEYGSTEPSNCKQCKTCSLHPKISYNRITHP